MGGTFTRVFALLLIAVVAIGAQCVASCSLESIAQPPCHKMAKRSCAHDQAAGNSSKIIKVELAALDMIVPVADQPLLVEIAPAAPLQSSKAHEPPSFTVLRI